MGCRLSSAAAVVLALAVLAAGCVSHTVHSYPSRLREHAAELQRRGHARVETVDHGLVEVHASTRISVSERDGDAKLTREVTIGELVAGCDDPAPGGGGAGRSMRDPDCLADRVLEQDLAVGEKKERRIGAAITSIITGGTGVGLIGLCVVECEGKDVAIGAGLVVAGLFIFAVGFALH